MDRKKFFDAVRPSVFNGAISGDQVKGIEALLDACAAKGVTDPRQVAYVLATPMIETGGSFVPITESLNYSAEALKAKFPSRISPADADRYGRTTHIANQPEIANRIYGGAWGKTNLGNTQPGDGWAFRGRGLCQITGRRNYTLFGLDTNPDAAATLPVAAQVMVTGMRDGDFTGRKLADYFSPSKCEWREARKIINGLDRADDIAKFAINFHKAIAAAM